MKKNIDIKTSWFERWEAFLVPRMRKPGLMKYPYAILAWFTLVVMFSPEYLFYRYNLFCKWCKNKFKKLL